MLVRTNRTVYATLAAMIMLAASLFTVMPAKAFGHHHGHPHNFIQRHPTLMGVGAGLATHHALKVKAAHDKRMGKKLNWAERHPTMSGIGVGVITHHIIKHTTH